MNYRLAYSWFYDNDKLNDSNYFNLDSNDNQIDLYDKIETNTYFNNRKEWTGFTIGNSSIKFQYTEIPENNYSVNYFPQSLFLNAQDIGICQDSYDDAKNTQPRFFFQGKVPMVIQNSYTPSICWGRVLIQNGFDENNNIIKNNIYYIEHFIYENNHYLKIWSCNDIAAEEPDFSSFICHTNESEPISYNEEELKNDNQWNNTCYYIQIPSKQEYIILDIQAAGGYGNQIVNWDEMFGPPLIYTQYKVKVPQGGGGGCFLRILINLSTLPPIEITSQIAWLLYLSTPTPQKETLRIILNHNNTNSNNQEFCSLSRYNGTTHVESDIAKIYNGQNAKDDELLIPFANFSGITEINRKGGQGGSYTWYISQSNPNIVLMEVFEGGSASSLQINYEKKSYYVQQTRRTVWGEFVSFSNKTINLATGLHPQWLYWKNNFSINNNSYYNSISTTTNNQVIGYTKSTDQYTIHQYFARQIDMLTGGCSLLGIINNSYSYYNNITSCFNNSKSKINNFGAGGCGELAFYRSSSSNPYYQYGNWIQNNYNWDTYVSYTYGSTEASSTENAFAYRPNNQPGPACFILHW